MSSIGQTDHYWSNLAKPENFHRRPLHCLGRCSSPVGPVQARKSQIHQIGLPSSKTNQTKQQQHEIIGNSPRCSSEQNSTKGLHRSDRWEVLVRPVRTWALGINNARGSTPPNPTLDLPIRSTNLHKTLVIARTPHGHSIAKIWSTKTF
jgi:hypothetical protein